MLHTAMMQPALLAVIILICGSSVTRCENNAGNSTVDRNFMEEVNTKLDKLDRIEHQLQILQQQLQFLQTTNQGRRDVSRSLQSAVHGQRRDCADIMDAGATTSGEYTVYVGRPLRPVKVYCDMKTDGGGWLVIQRRQDGSVNFQRTWTDYAKGFGSLQGEFWLGNDALHSLTAGKQYHLRIDLGDWNGNRRYAEYTNFKVASACENYKLLSVGTYCGNAGNSLAPHVGQMFSTADRDNDAWPNNCAATFKGAWWYSACHYSSLNGAYLKGPHTSYADGVEWFHWTGHYYSLKFTEIKIRPSDA